MGYAALLSYGCRAASGVSNSTLDYSLPDARQDVYTNALLVSSFKDLPRLISFYSLFMLSGSHTLWPIVVQVAGMNPHRDQGIAYIEALKAAG